MSAASDMDTRDSQADDPAQLREQVETLRRQLEEERTYSHAQLAAQRQAARAELDRVLSAAKSSWRMAEEELARTEAELEKTRALLLREREQNRRLKEEIKELRRVLRQRAAPSSTPERPLASARESAPAVHGTTTALPLGAELGTPPALPETGWGQLGSAQIADELADEFLLLEADESYSHRDPQPPPSEPADRPEAVERKKIDPMPLPVDKPVAAQPQILVASAMSRMARRRRKIRRWVLGFAVCATVSLALYAVLGQESVRPWMRDALEAVTVRFTR